MADSVDGVSSGASPGVSSSTMAVQSACIPGGACCPTPRRMDPAWVLMMIPAGWPRVAANPSEPESANHDCGVCSLQD